MTDSPRYTRSDAAMIAAFERERQRTYQKQEARQPPPMSEQAGSTMQLCEPSDCPFPHELLTKSFGFTGIPMSDDEATRCRQAHKQTPGSCVERATVLCSPSPMVIPGGARAAYPAQLWHAEMLVDGATWRKRGSLSSVTTDDAHPCTEASRGDRRHQRRAPVRLAVQERREHEFVHLLTTLPGRLSETSLESCIHPDRGRGCHIVDCSGL